MICDAAAAEDGQNGEYYQHHNPLSFRQLQAYIALMGGGLTPEQVTEVCYLNLYGLIVNLLALAALAGTLIYVGWKFEWKRHNLLALHNLRSALVLVSILVGICELAQYCLIMHRIGALGASSLPTVEGLSESDQDNDGSTTAPLATAVLGLCYASVTLASMLLGAVLVRIIELKDKSGLLYVALAAQGAQAVAKWCKFKYINDVMDTTKAGLPSSLAMLSASVLTALALVDGITMCLENSSPLRYLPATATSKKTTTTDLKSSSTPFLSRVTFWWITPLLWRGFAKPLELENLGMLPEKDTSRYHYDQFLFIYQRLKKPASLWRCYVLNCWQMFLAGGVFKLMGDLCALVGPLCISNIVDYIAKPLTAPSVRMASGDTRNGSADDGGAVIPPYDNAPFEYNLRNQSISTPNDGTSRLGPLTWTELLANGWFVALLVLVSSVAQGTFSQASTHIMDMEGIKLKNALQGLVYRKTLLLSSSGPQMRPTQQKCRLDGKSTTRGNSECTDQKTNDSCCDGSETNRRPAEIGVSDHRSRPLPGKVNFNVERMADVTAVAKPKTTSQYPLQNSEEKIKHKIATIDSDDQQQFASGQAEVNCHPPYGSQAGAAAATVDGEDGEKQAKVIAAGSASEAIGNGNRRCAARTDGMEQQVGGNAAADAGTITNLMSDDAFNVMSFVKIAHYVWAIPLKIGVVMYLLYQLLGISTVIGSVVCIVTMTPLQFIIGKMMSANSKKASECTDERLRRINEVLLGIKLIKLNAWENVFQEKISRARRKELRHLDLDSCYWTLMMLLTQISSVLITFVTVAVFTHLEQQNEPSSDVQFTAARLFASLALFNQLTVPLFIFPITIPIILSAVVSTRRLEAFLRRPEVSGEKRLPAMSASAVQEDCQTSDASFDNSCEDNEPEGDTRQPVPVGLQHNDDDLLQGVVEKLMAGTTKKRTLPRSVAKSGDNLCYESAERESENELNSQYREGKLSDVRMETAPAAGVGSSSGTPLLSKSAADCSSDQSKTIRQNTDGSAKEHRKINPQAMEPPVSNCRFTECGRMEQKSHGPVTANESRFAKQPNSGRGDVDDNDGPAVSMKNARFQWGLLVGDEKVETALHTKPKGGQVLKVDQLVIPKGKLTIIVGRSGSGKSSLLAALLNEINHLSGEVKWNKYSTIAYVPQQPWLLNATVRDNILFGEPFRPKRFNRILKFCALKPDIELMPDGDMSEIGERGIKLSGGQRQRIVMARAFYSTASVVVMDDPLSSLDNEVGKFVFDHGIRRMLRRQKRTVIMVTQSLQLLFSADYIIAMEAFTVSATGTLSEIENNFPQTLRQWKAIIAKEQQSNETGLSPGKTARERWKLFKIVSRISLQKRHAHDEYYEQPAGTLLYTPAALQRNSSLFGSRFHTHDLPLPIDECHGGDVQLRRHYSKRYRADGRGFSDGAVPTGRRGRLSGANGASRYQFDIQFAQHYFHLLDFLLSGIENATKGSGTEVILGVPMEDSNIPTPDLQEVKRVIELLETNNAAGKDHLPAELYRHGNREKYREHYLPTHYILFGFKAAYDPTDRDQLRQILHEHNFPNKLMRLVLDTSDRVMKVFRAHHSNNVLRPQSLQTGRGEAIDSQPVHRDERSPATVNPRTSSRSPVSRNSFQLVSLSPTDDGTVNGRPHERIRFSDAIGFRKLFRSLSTGAWYRGRHSNPIEMAGVAVCGKIPSASSKGSSVKSLPSGENPSYRRDEPHSGWRYSLRRLISKSSGYSEEAEEEAFTEDKDANDGSNWFLTDEERKYGTIPARIYWLYLKASGPHVAAIFLVSALVQQCLRAYTDFWLQNWTEGTQSHRLPPEDDADPLDITYNFRIYALLSATCILLATISFPTGQMAGSKARRRLHRKLLASVLKNSIHFFETVPLGRIMNRLSIDIAVVDKKIAATSQKLLQFILLCLCAVLINSVVTPYFILLTIPICGIYYIVQKFYRCSSRELQRLESITYSPIIAHFSETIEGVTTIRAYRQETRFTETLFRRMEANNVAQVILNCSNRWLGIALDYLGAIIVFVAICSALITASLKPETTNASLIGLAINYALLVPIYLNWVVKLAAEMEMYIGAVERIQYYIESSRKRARERNKVKYKPVPISWPQKGDIVFENVSLRYESQKENVITNLNLTIPTGQRIGICGRTGSGKSSLALSLFGVLELVDGRILIDDVDIAGIHSEELRSRLSIIPQEVVLFGGSLRENLDPRGHFGDLELWNCLEMAQLKEVVMELPDGLDTQIDEGRPLLSAGQRQLLCLARAILRGSVCLVLDEATSSLDLETEKLVLEAAGRAFKGRTVITIAHRLHSLFDYDRVVVLERGTIVEDGCPRVLKKRSDSKFAAMLKASSSDDYRHQSDRTK
ncbi:ATP-binding cassette sub-family C member Sur [Sabethes cyaneus]|uniref:ATP-binding cassette sub-family C member Sur n=1 Tax=Sabethes cyaneus TaxID=53552 RepID=UPI00237DEDD6|nr:ATP-binding cassette sub-family C member Sur [Sabethes cyaneus]